MFELSAGLLCVLAFIGFAIYGVVELIRRLVTRRPSAMPDARVGDAIAACRALDRLRLTDAIGWVEYHRVRDALRDAVPGVALPARLIQPVSPPTADVYVAKAVQPQPSADRKSPTIPSTAGSEQDPEPSRPKAVPQAKTVAPTRPRGFADLPADKPTKPRRPWSDVLAGFMLERNIRWGELASGILIVGSSVGFVVSIREELQSTIPYFPALLFMLITAAIHAAGIYTLKRWRLRNTSRGVLIIGLLLVPLNVLAACILAQGDQRALSDPIYWVAIITGVVGFSAMTWMSSKCLLRRGHLPLVIAVMGSALSLLIINRIENPAGMSWITWLMSMPALASFLVGEITVAPRLWARQRWSGRTVNRLWLCLGVGFFAFVAAQSLVVLRSPHLLSAVVSLAPISAVACLLSGWMGSIVYQGAMGRESTVQRIAGMSVGVLGLSLALVSTFVSIVNPTILAPTAFLTGFGILLASWNRRFVPTLPFAWGCISLGVLATLHLGLGGFPWDQWATIDQLGEVATHAVTGLCLMTCGVSIMVAQRWVLGRAQRAIVSGGVAGIPPNDAPINHPSRSLPSEFATASQQWNMAAGGGISALGCLIALVASFLHPNSAFDMHVATTLLGIASAGLLWTAVKHDHSQGSHAAAVVLIGFLFHGLIWNHFLAARLAQITFDVDCRWQLAALLSAVVLAMCTAARRWIRSQGVEVDEPWKVDAASRSLVAWSSMTNVVALIGAATLVSHQIGLASLFAFMGAINSLLIAWSSRQETTSAGVVMSGAAAISLTTAEFGLRFGWHETLWSVHHVAHQISCLSIGCAVWMALFPYLDRTQLRDWLVKDRGVVAQLAGYTLVLAITVLCLAGIIPQVAAELVATIDVSSSLISLSANIRPLAIALASTSLAAVVALGVRTKVWDAAALVVVWLLAWSLGAVPLESTKSVASALRWLLPVGGVVCALGIGSRSWWLPSWKRVRRALRLHKQEEWTDSQIRDLINFALLIVVSLVLLITTIAISRVMLYGVASLGGPLAPSFFETLRKDVSFGGPIAIIVSTFLWYAITEKRSWLAVAGSAVFQYVVVVAIVLLFASPHPQLASAWFLNIMQAVSLGMSGYGLVWYLFRTRVGTQRIVTWSPWTQLDVHTGINGLLVASLAALIAQRFFFFPTQAAGWINEAGGWLGVSALGSVIVLAGFVWRHQLRRFELCFMSACGLAVAAFVASVVDRYQPPASWWPFRTLTLGAMLVTGFQVGWLWWREYLDSYVRRRRGDVRAIVPIMASGTIAVLFALRGGASDSSFPEAHLAMLVALLGMSIAYGLVLHSAWASWFAALLTLFVGFQVHDLRPFPWFSGNDDLPNLWMAGLLAIALIWASFHVVQRVRAHASMRRSFCRFSNFMVPIATSFVLLISLLERSIGDYVFSSPIGCVALLLMAALLIVNLWNDHARFRVFGPCVFSLAIPILVLNRLSIESTTRVASGLFSAALVVMFWGYLYAKRSILRTIGKQWHVPRLAAVERAWSRRLPTLQLIVAAVASMGAFILLFESDVRLVRYLSAMTPVVLGLALIPLAHRVGRRWLQAIAIGMMTLGGVFLCWADLSTAEMTWSSFQLPMRTTLAIGLAVFIYGWWLPRKLAHESVWLISVRRATVLTSVLAVICFGWLIVAEVEQPGQVGSGVPVTAAVAVSVVVIGMISGLLAIAVMPQHDPLSLSLEWRQAYVYAAQLVGGMLLLHAYLSMPWLFQFGIRQYWPFVAMLLAFGGVGMAHLLDRRDLMVLGGPIFNSAAALPVVAAGAFWAIDSEVDASLFMLLAGMLYLVVSISRQSLWSGLAAVIFGNLALWLFYDKFPTLAFLLRPQLWLIPPAVSVLVAGQFHRDRLSASQLATLRYVSAAVIYLSSSGEIFMTGLGQSLWPPMVLIVLSVLGIFAGMLLQVRAFLYLGSVFLLMSLVTMVAHAQQRLDHVWPWWAFGIGLGTAILVMFGLFEKRRNEMRSITSRLREWDY